MKAKMACLSISMLLLMVSPVYGLYLVGDQTRIQTPYAEGEVLVKFRKDVVSNAANKIASSYLMSVEKEFSILSQRRGQTYLLLKSGRMSTEEMIEVLKDDSGIEDVTPNYSRSICETFPDDPRFDVLWGLDNTGQTCGGVTDADIDAPEAWDINTGSSDVVIAVIDTGVDYTHEDLTDNMWVNPGEIPGNGIDDDGNGYIDDIHGIDTANNDTNPMDDHKHGTHTSGTSAAVGNNATGITGVNWNARIMALKFLRASGSGYISDSIECIQYAIDMKVNRGVNVVAINASYGGTGSSAIAKDAIETAGEAGIVFVAAAANEGTNNDNRPFYPCAYNSSNVICVAATDPTDNLAWFSNYGINSVDLAAPGVEIKSTVPSGMGSDAHVTANTTTYQAIGMEHAGLTDGITGFVYNCGLGYPDDFPPEVSGNIALIERGEIYFRDKTTHAQNAGAVAVIFYNNEPCNLKGTLIDPGDWVPVVSISQEDGHDLIDEGLPTTATLVNKISNYETFQGTSMAAPHVTGAVALLAAEYPYENESQRIDRILSAVDILPGLEGKIATGGRLNLASSMMQGRYCNEVDSGAIDIKGKSGNIGSQIIQTVRIQDAPNMVNTLGFEITYNPGILRYTGNFNRGNGVEDFDYFDCYELSEGVVRCGGFEAEQDIIPQGASCDVVDLQFEVIYCESETCPDTLALQDLVDDLEGWSNSHGCFCCSCMCDVDSGALDIKDARGNLGTEVVHTVRVQDAPNLVNTLGFDVTFNPGVLDYTDIFNRGDCVEDFDYFDCYELSEGVVRCGGFEAEQDIIPQGASCDVVDLQFEVVKDPCEPEACPGTLDLQELVDDVDDWSTSHGCLCCGCSCDVSGDGACTPMDALCSFQVYLAICPTACGNCKDICCDVTKDGQCTPADALCRFQEYLGIHPNCFD